MIQNQHLYCVILAGGSGERLWPLSRIDEPKQFLKIQGTTLLEQTIARVAPLVTDRRNILISTTAPYAPLVQQLVGHLIGNIIVEPSARNTAPAILYSCVQLLAQDPQAQIIFVPADAYIPPAEYAKFQDRLCAAVSHVQHNPDAVAIMGVKPSYPATGYGYIEYEQTTSTGCYPVSRFHEKPTHEVASYYLQIAQMLWNIGVVVIRADACLALGDTIAPELGQAVRGVLRGDMSYEQLPSISFDYAILEKSRDVVVIPLDISWSDVGNLNTLLSLMQFTQEKMSVVSCDAQNNLVYAPQKLVALLGVDDLCVVDTRDVLLVARRSQVEAVKLIIAQLKQAGLSDYL